MTLPPAIGDAVAPPRAPSLDGEAIGALVRRTHALDVREVRALGGEWATNARLTLRDGSERMCKSVEASDATHARRLAALFAWRGSLASSAVAAGLPAAAPLPTAAGSSVAIVETDGRSLLVVVSPWMPGVLLSAAALDAPALARARRSLGASAAGMCQALRDHDGFGSDARHAWAFEDMSSTIGTALASTSTASRIQPADLRAVRELLLRFDQVASRLDALPHGLTHHDLNDFNVLVDPSSGEVSGIVDFDDARIAPLASEIAIAGAYAMLGADDPVGALAEVVAGAAAVRPFAAGEGAVLLAGSAARLCLNAALWTARSTSSNAVYGAARMARTWPTIRLLAEADWSSAQTRVAVAARS